MKQGVFNNKYRISSTRLKNYNYSSPGYYFVTICVNNHNCYFGKISNNKMNLSTVGKTVKKILLSIPNHYKNIDLDEYTIMPNHVHGIIIIKNNNISGRDGACPVSTNKNNVNSLANIVGSFKSASTKEIHKTNPNFSWQTRYYDHIIRSEKSLNAIRFYIRYNHLNWDTDEENPDR